MTDEDIREAGQLLSEISSLETAKAGKLVLAREAEHRGMINGQFRFVACLTGSVAQDLVDGLIEVRRTRIETLKGA